MLSIIIILFWIAFYVFYVHCLKSACSQASTGLNDVLANDTTRKAVADAIVQERLNELKK